MHVSCCFSPCTAAGLACRFTWRVEPVCYLLYSCHACVTHWSTVESGLDCRFACCTYAGTEEQRWCRAGCVCGWCVHASDAPQLQARRLLPGLPAMPTSKLQPSLCRSMCVDTWPGRRCVITDTFVLVGPGRAWGACMTGAVQGQHNLQA